ncbi:S8 family peptidase [Amycolatopsis sp. CA-230715]|uniref:S8 family peptidase n=1 Tax=Amycolatopsis sp. CA-230715 TaxID=2745196 RepID=UPI001C0263CB|nr:S8 family serine peptidase [Amycolatopsis sp. CA-230715]QWF85474.1 hypothetical protein HUW46_08928 [Amycolatopsis sp. CA-230715]
MTEAAGTTGRYLILLEHNAAALGARAITNAAGLRTTSTAELAGASTAQLLGTDGGLLFHQLGVALVSADEDQYAALTTAAESDGPISSVEAERTVFAIEDKAAPAAEDGELTWGLQAVNAANSAATGAGVRVAVLDTGFDAEHPDFAGRQVITSSFVDGEDAKDGHGHGTHCIGTSCGPRTPETKPGYGIAHQAEIYAGKVLSNEGSGSDGGILAGISWAISNGCAVVSMSLGAPTQAGQPYSKTFEQVAQRAMERGTLVVAAAGNESKRSEGLVAPVGHPANCPSIMAIGAIDSAGAIADFSCGTVDDIGAVDLVGPGVDVYSSWPMPKRYNTISGTSMATPHAAGIAALTAQQYGSRGWELWARLTQHARRLALAAVDSGAGLVQAP